MNAASGTRQSAGERREAIILAAAKEFAADGFSGTSTMAIARRVGVSQPYLFQLFGTKKELFIAAIRGCFDRTRAAFEASAAAARKETSNPAEILDRMGHTYKELLRDRDMLRLQLQAYAACGDPEVQAVVRDEFATLYRSVARVSGADDPALESWFAMGMLLNVAASIGDINSPDAVSLAALGGAHAHR
jgi:AcrR family transcriptional regulator